MVWLLLYNASHHPCFSFSSFFFFFLFSFHSKLLGGGVAVQKEYIHGERKNRKQMWLLSFWNKIQTHERLKRTPILTAQHKTRADFRGKPLFSKQQTDGKTMINEDDYLSSLSCWAGGSQKYHTRLHQQLKQEKQTIFVFHLSSFTWQVNNLLLWIRGLPRMFVLFC